MIHFSVEKQNTDRC